MRDVVNHIKHWVICQETKHAAGNPCYLLQSRNSSKFNDLVHFDNLKLCKTLSGNNGPLVIIDHFTKFAEAFPCVHDKYVARTTVKIVLNKWFASHGTPAKKQSDNATNFPAEIAQELVKAEANRCYTNYSLDSNPRAANSGFMSESGMDFSAPCWSMYGESPVVACLVEL